MCRKFLPWHNMMITMMAPRTLGEIFSFLISDIENFECNYLKSIEEIYSHPKDEIITHFNSSVDESCIHNLREFCLVKLLIGSQSNISLLN